MLSHLQVQGWRQFGNVDLEFHDRLTVLTGANASGKTTLLTMLGQHFSWIVNFVSLPSRAGGGRLRYSAGVRGETETEPQPIVGSIRYASGQEAQLIVQGINVDSPTFQVTISNIQPLAGLLIPSHRSYHAYQQIQNIPPRFSAADQILQNYINELLQRYMGAYIQRTPMYSLKETLIAAGIYSQDTSHLVGNPEAESVFTGFREVLTQLFPESLGFAGIRIEPPEVLIDTSAGSFAIDAASGGLTALMEMAWQVFLRSREAQQFVVCIDEPENHLHPELQRIVLPRLLAAFPGIQFIVSTHSPFVVTSVRESNVYVLRYLEDGLVYSELLDQVNKAATASEVLRQVLGVPATMPVWAEEQLAEIMNHFQAASLSVETLEELRQELDQVGLADVFPAAAAEIAERENLIDQANEEC